MNYAVIERYYPDKDKEIEYKRTKESPGYRKASHDDYEEFTTVFTDESEAVKYYNNAMWLISVYQGKRPAPPTQKEQ
jgi:hypothetical protein